MKSREEVEKLKEDWLKNPEWDLETEEGFEEYHDELLKFRKSNERKWKIKRNRDEARRHAELASKLCPMKFAATTEGGYEAHIGWFCDVQKCAWWNQGRECCSIAFLPHLEDLAEAANLYLFKNRDY